MAAITITSTLNWGRASVDSTQARQGGLPGVTQASQTALNSLKVEMSVSQTWAESAFDLSVPA